MSGSPRLGQQRFAKSGKVRDGKRGLTALAICADSYYLISIPFPPCGEVWCVGGVPPRQPHICHGEGPESALKLFRGDACFPAVRSFIHDVARRPNCGTRHKSGAPASAVRGDSARRRALFLPRYFSSPIMCITYLPGGGSTDGYHVGPTVTSNTSNARTPAVTLVNRPFRHT